ncbi:ABC transporter substrate-binding protein [Maridesulfovibrio hydrothermalis]|uniref:Extracellular ligand-binding receptor n=1 Tax=Maridesulfovibrio hydrothermalis AM13 = DSM 14728 TaxID=1121451 RepID=L0RI93_9BACT|nr:ABC transporter substrate-binding protein [Maridesulfovibrio hydrothermalis]CCO25336.1 Extracellular ligand-binding receptor [Maridesulfovibrio hydrothermalis AM13 = DSM 14728]
MKKNLFIIPAVLLLGILSILACDRSVSVKVQEEKHPGVFPDKVILGSSLALEGHASYLGTQTIHGALAYIKHINRQGGIHGRKIEIVSYDDSYDPPKCLINTQKLIIEDKIFALFCYVGTPTTVKVLPLVEDARIPLLGMFTGADALRKPFNRYIINIRPSYYQETKEAVRHMVEDLGITRIAVFYQYDAFGFDGLTGTELALKEFDLEPVARGSYTRGSLDVREGVQRIEDSEAQAVFMIGTSGPCIKFMSQLSKKNLHPVYYTVSFMGAREFARNLGDEQDMVIMSQVVPPFNKDHDLSTSEAASYIELLKQYYPQDTPNLVGLEGFFNARILIEGLQRSGRKLTREKFIKAIESMNKFEIAPGITVSYGKSDHQGMDKVYFTRFKNGGFELIRDWTELRGRVN